MSDNRTPLRSVELRQLRYFVAVAELLNFRQAADRLFITQPSLSHQIAVLEATLGVRLFDRSRRHVVLTQEGRELLDDARNLLKGLDDLLVKARRLGEADAEQLRVGFPEFANRSVIPDIIAAFRDRHPQARLTLIEGYSRTLLPELRQGRLDLGFMSVPPAEDPAGLRCETVVDDRAGLVMAATHRLAKAPEVPLSALAGVQVLLAERRVNPMLYDRVAGWLKGAGVEPSFLRVDGSGVYTYDTALHLVQSGEVVSFATEAIAGSLPAGVVWRPVAGPPLPFQIGAFWSPSNSSPLLGDFLEVMREIRDKRLMPAPIS